MTIKYSKLILEEFVFAPRNKKLFFANLVKRLNEAQKKFLNLWNQFGNFETDALGDKEDKEYYFSSILKSTDSREISFWNYHEFNYLKRLITNAFKPYSETVSENIEHLFGLIADPKTDMFTYYKFIGYIKQTLVFYVEKLEEGAKYFETMASISIDDYNESYNDYKEFFISNPVAPMKEFGQEVLEHISLLKTFYIPKLERILQMQGRYDDEQVKHKTADVETLYHATVNATTLATTGFKTNYKQSVEGLGGANTDKAGIPSVSFTADLYIAKEIARCLKEIIMIAKRQLDFYDIDTMAMQEGTSDEIKKGFPWYSREENVKNATPVEVFNFYRYYLSYSKVRYDPWFVDTSNLMNVMKNKNVEDVGVLVCKVDMTDPNIKYLYSMEEYRINPKNILSIEKVLK